DEDAGEERRARAEQHSRRAAGHGERDRSREGDRECGEKSVHTPYPRLRAPDRISHRRYRRHREGKRQKAKGKSEDDEQRGPSSTTFNFCLLPLAFISAPLWLFPFFLVALSIQQKRAAPQPARAPWRSAS